MKTMNFNGLELSFSIEAYAVGNSLALGVYDAKKEEKDDAVIITVNLRNPGDINPNQVYLDTNNYPNSVAIITAAGGRFTGIVGQSGFCEYPLFEIPYGILQGMDPEGYKKYVEPKINIGRRSGTLSSRWYLWNNSFGDINNVLEEYGFEVFELTSAVINDDGDMQYRLALMADTISGNSLCFEVISADPTVQTFINNTGKLFEVSDFSKMIKSLSKVENIAVDEAEKIVNTIVLKGKQAAAALLKVNQVDESGNARIIKYYGYIPDTPDFCKQIWSLL